MNEPAPLGTVAAALQHGAQLMHHDPGRAQQQAQEILLSVPGHPLATLLLCQALRAQGNAAATVSMLEGLTAAQPTWAAAYFELATS